MNEEKFIINVRHYWDNKHLLCVFVSMISLASKPFHQMSYKLRLILSEGKIRRTFQNGRFQNYHLITVLRPLLKLKTNMISPIEGKVF